MAMQSISITEGKHFSILYYPDHGYEWQGKGVFHRYCCDRPFATEDEARTEAVRALLKALS